MSDLPLFDKLQRQTMRRGRRDQQDAVDDLKVDAVALLAALLPRDRRGMRSPDAASRTSTWRINAGQSMVSGAEPKKIYCKPAAYP
jgi:hypothetical protein